MMEETYLILKVRKFYLLGRIRAFFKTPDHSTCLFHLTLNSSPEDEGVLG
jgi:hypothetical protein